MKTPKKRGLLSMALLSRHRRHLEAVRNSLGGRPVVEALSTALMELEPLWEGLPERHASRMAVHMRSLLLLGAVRASAPTAAELEHVDRLEVTLLQAVLHTWLPRLGPAGEVVRARMEKRGPTAVNAHLVQQLAMLHGSEAVLPAAGRLRDQVFLLDALVIETVQHGEAAGALLAERSQTAVRRMLLELEPAAAVLGWQAVGALWLSVLAQLGGGTQDLTATKAYTQQELELVEAFELLG